MSQTDAIRPFFKASNPQETFFMRLFVGANVVLTVLATGYLGLSQGRTIFPIWGWPPALLLAWFLADFASGAVHWGLDTWFDEPFLGRVVAIAREHHTHPQHILGYSFLEFATLGSIPSVLVLGPLVLLVLAAPAGIAAYAAMIVLAVVSLCLLFGTSFHNLAHHRPRSRILHALQRVRLLMPPNEHWEHHRDQTRRYAVINGWSNHVCDRVGFWRATERAIEALTGAVARRDDLQWQRHFAETGELSNPQPAKSAVRTD